MKKSELIRIATRDYMTQINFIMYGFAYLMCLVFIDASWSASLFFAGFFLAGGWIAVLAVAHTLRVVEAIGDIFRKISR